MDLEQITQSDTKRFGILFEQWIYDIGKVLDWNQKEWEDKEDCGSFDHDYEKRYFVTAQQIVSGLNPSMKDIAALVEKHKDLQGIKYAGLFVSAKINQSDDAKIVVPGFAVPLNYIGFHLPAGKTLISDGATDYGLGKNALGTVISFGPTESDCGSVEHNPKDRRSYGARVTYDKAKDHNASGTKGPWFHLGSSKMLNGSGAYAPIFNFADGGTDFGYRSLDIVVTTSENCRLFAHEATGIVLALKNPKYEAWGDKDIGFGDLRQAKLVLKEDECGRIPGLGLYMFDMQRRLEEGRTDPDKTLAFLETLGPNPAEKIRTDILRLLRDCGYKLNHNSESGRYQFDKP